MKVLDGTSIGSDNGRDLNIHSHTIYYQTGSVSKTVMIILASIIIVFAVIIGSSYLRQSSVETEVALSYGDMSFEDGMVFPESSTRQLNDQDIAKLSGDTQEELAMHFQMGINEIYAKNGHLFETEEVSAFYNLYEWYYNLPDKHTISSWSEFSQIEIYNMNLLIKTAEEYGFR